MPPTSEGPRRKGNEASAFGSKVEENVDLAESERINCNNLGFNLNVYIKCIH